MTKTQRAEMLEYMDRQASILGIVFSYPARLFVLGIVVTITSLTAYETFGLFGAVATSGIISAWGAKCADLIPSCLCPQ